MEILLNPFGESRIEDYSKVFEKFKLKKVDKNILSKIKKPSRFLRRGIDFAHLDLENFLDSPKKERAVVSGIKPSNIFHLGSKLAAEKIIYFQKEFKAKAFYVIADLESYVDNGIPLNEAHHIAIDNLADMLALGLNYKRSYIYKQSEEKRVMNLAYIFSRRVTNAHMKDIYGERNIGLYFAAFTQAGDILLPQLKEFGFSSVLVPVGIDQLPHILLTRDIVEKFKEFEFKRPSAIFNKFFISLKGSYKMSKRDPMSVISLNDKDEEIIEKIKKSLSGGQKTIEEHKRLGGNPEKSAAFQLLKFHFLEDDKKLKEIEEKYRKGEILDGELKEIAIEKTLKFMKRHRRKKEKMKDVAKKILEK